MHFNTLINTSQAGNENQDVFTFGAVDKEGSVHEDMDMDTFEAAPVDNSMHMDLQAADSEDSWNPGTDKRFPFYVERYPRAAKIVKQGKTFMDLFDEDIHASKCVKNVYYPFASADKWELASFLLKSGLSIDAIDEYLKLQLVSGVHIPSSQSILISM